MEDQQAMKMFNTTLYKVGIGIIVVIAILLAIFFLRKDKPDETIEVPNTPINIQTDLNFTVPGKTDEEVQAELNKELTEDEYNAFIDFIDKSQQDIIQLDDINNSDYVEYNEDGSITYLDSNGNVVTYNKQIDVPDNIFNMSLEEFIEYRENSEQVKEEKDQQQKEEEYVEPEDFVQMIHNSTEEEKQQWEESTGIEIIESDDSAHLLDPDKTDIVIGSKHKVDTSKEGVSMEAHVNIK